MGDELVVVECCDQFINQRQDGLSVFEFVRKKFTNQFLQVNRRDEVIFFAGFLFKLFQ